MRIESESAKNQWVTAAFECMLDGGLRNIRIEALARALGVTKGSFYHHFANRAELVRAAVERWELEGTDAIIALANREGAPAERLHRLLGVIAGSSAQQGRGELMLFLEASDEGVGDAVARVTGRRIAYVAQLLEEHGVPSGLAQRRAVMAVAEYHGARVIAAGTDSLPVDERVLDVGDAIRFLETTLLAP
ncbi:TetR/AcrR family transcriptional regulator [Lysinibacter cavernae]|uniref:AcrR family transcriptional regulator n=1 Tax=Lysinibacter cavernae TaxID=1640652 RepID=A0A7X5TUM3_9MICO|nr:TetR/AcrR family transcriptional regulator [Lysinibacter cavernae]NIH54714.1 AcrR family transcriptional regulator [Lysinibacter cavernae]